MLSGQAFILDKTNALVDEGEFIERTVAMTGNDAGPNQGSESPPELCIR